jgi:hypothetical protein
VNFGSHRNGACSCLLNTFSVNTDEDIRSWDWS